MTDQAGLEATIDRIEEGVAVIAIRGGGEVTLDANYLPEGSSEGMAIRIRLELDPERTESLRADVEDLQRRLREGGA